MQSGAEFNINGKSPDFCVFLDAIPKWEWGNIPLQCTGGQSTKQTSSITMLDRSVDVVCRN